MFKGCFLNEGKSFELQIKSEKESRKKKKMRIQILCNREAIMNGKNVMGVNDL